MKYLQYALMILALATTTSGFSQYQKYIDKADAEYKTGDYASARKQIAKMQKKVSKKLGNENRYTAIALVKEAKINVGLGELVSVMKPLKAGIEMSKKVNGESSAEHAFILMEAAEVLIAYGHFKLADEYLSQSAAAFAASSSLIEDIKAQLEVQKAQVLSGKGFYSEAIRVVNSQEDYFLKRAKSSEGGKEDIEQRKEEFALMMIVKANSLRKMGNYQSADSAFIANLSWVDDNLKKSHLLWAQNAFLNAKLLEENGLAVAAQAKLYEEAYEWAVRKYEYSHNTVMTMQANLMRAYYLNGQKSRLKITQADFKKSLKEFDKKSIFNLAEDKMDLTFDIADQDIQQLENEVNGMLSESVIPEFHQERITLLELAKKVALYAGRHKNTEAYDNAILKIKGELLGEDAPEYHLTKVKLANYYVDFTDKFNEASGIYTESYHQVVAPEITKGHIDYLDIQNHLAKFYQETDNYERASEILDDALLAARVKYDDKDIEYGRELEKIANLQISIGEYDKATDNIEDAIEIMADTKSGEALTYLADALITKAKLLSIKGEYDQAEQLIYDSDDFRAQGALTTDVASLNQAEDLGGLYMNIGRYADAQEKLVSALFEKQNQFGPNSRHLNYTLVQNGKLNLIKGDYTEAEQQARRANSLSTSIFGDESTKTVPSMLLLSDVYTVIGDYEKAEGLLKKSIDIQEGKFGQEHIDVGNSISKLALVYFYQDKSLTEIQTLFQEAERIIGKKLGSNNPTYAEILKNMAVANIAASNYSLAFTYLNQAEAVWSKKIGKRNNINAATTQVLKGDIYYKQKDYSQAERFYRDARKQYEKVFNVNHPEYVKVQSKLSKTYFMQER
ncbi:MAG: tetratricopeptide repeat protein, partial [Bacteroidota bacterium]